MLAHARPAPGDPILEIGAGTGKATLAFARRGLSLRCLEPGERLAALLRDHCRELPNVRVETVRFEEAAIEPGSQALVFAAQSFHWVDAETGLSRCAEALRPGGTLALFWNRPQRGGQPVHRRIEASYGDHAPVLAWDAPGRWRRDYAAELREHPAFGEPEVSGFPFSREYDAASYVDLLRTQSDHRMLPEATRNALLAAIAGEIEAAGGRVGVDYIADLYLARREPA